MSVKDVRCLQHGLQMAGILAAHPEKETLSGMQSCTPQERDISAKQAADAGQRTLGGET